MARMANKGSFKAGDKRAGRKPGTANRVTKETREAFRLLIEANTDKLDGWLQKAAKKNPIAALTLLKDLAEFVIPKLQRTELTGKDGEALQVTLVKGL
jgi:hypothetical protein